MKTENYRASFSMICLTTILLAGASAEATSLDLTTAGSSGFINGGFFTTTDTQSTGSGVIDSFVRVTDMEPDTAEGYNADARPVMEDVNTSPTFTHDILLSDVPLVSLGGISYYEFLLDINQNSHNPLLSLDKIDIYTRATALTTANTLVALSGTSTLRYSLDGAPDGDSEILLDYDLNSGSGSGDMFAYIPQSQLGSTSDFVYLYSMFGGKAGYQENAGYEEWAVRTPDGGGPGVPDGGSTIALLGFALLGVDFLRRKISRN